MPTRLEDTEVAQRLASLHGWALRDGKLHRRFRFQDFAGAFGFMAAAAIVAERMNHHPEWSNVYNVVEVNLVTHDAGGIGERDFELAKVMSELAARAGGGTGTSEAQA